MTYLIHIKSAPYHYTIPLVHHFWTFVNELVSDRSIAGGCSSHVNDDTEGYWKLRIVPWYNEWYNESTNIDITWWRTTHESWLWVSELPSDLHGIFGSGLIHWKNWGELTHLLSGMSHQVHIPYIGILWMRNPAPVNRWAKFHYKG